MGDAQVVMTWRQVRRTYLVITGLSTLSASLIWGINTLFLLDAGLSNAQAFAANAFYTAGMVVFEIPTGVVADTRGRRVSYLLGAGTLLAATLIYYGMWQTQGPFWGWALASAFLGLGFTFFSGAMEAWLVDALGATGYQGELDSVFARGQVVAGVAMLTGSVAGGIIAQVSSLGVPYLVRAGLLGVTAVAAMVAMRDLGFTRRPSAGPVAAVRTVLNDSIESGLRNRPVRWVMIAQVFIGGVSVYAFYAAQPYLLELYGDSGAFGVAGLAASIVAASQIIGGLAVPLVRRVVRRRTDALMAAAVLGVVALGLLAVAGTFWVALALLAAWALLGAAVMPMRQSYVNGLIPSDRRATVLSFDSLMSSTGGVVTQPVLGRVADAGGYGLSYLVGAAVSVMAVPFLWLARREQASSDAVPGAEPPAG